MGKLPKKRTKVLAYKAEEGKLKAQTDHDAKTWSSKKQLRASIFKHLGNMINRIDPLKLGAILVVTYMIKQGIEWTEEAVAILEGTSKADLIGFPFSVTFWWKTLGFMEEDPEVAQIRKEMDMPQAEILQWGISFALAWFIMEHGAEILKAGGNIIGIAKGLLGMLK